MSFLPALAQPLVTRNITRAIVEGERGVETVYNVYLIIRRLSSYFFVQNGAAVSLSRGHISTLRAALV